MKPRPLGSEPPRDDPGDDVLAEFCGLLLDALQINEVRAAITDVVRAEQYRRDMWTARTQPATPAGPARNQPLRRGH